MSPRASVTDDNGRIGVLAIDHRDALRAVIDPSNPADVPRDVMVEFKRVILSELSDLATGVMLEPEYSIPDLVGELADGVGFSAALEAQGYAADPGGVVTELLDGWSAAQAADAGAAVAKLLSYVDPGAEAHFAAQRAVIADAHAQCQAAGLPLVLEPLGIPGAPDRGAATLAAVEGTLDLGAEIMKVAWPGDDHLDTLATMLEGRTWVLLSAGVGFDEYYRQVKAAVAAGASGYMAGRAVWREATEVAPGERAAVLRDVARPRLTALRELLG